MIFEWPFNSRGRFADYSSGGVGDQNEVINVPGLKDIF